MADISIYPDAIDGYAQLPLVVDTVTEIDAITVNRLRSAIINIETELGTLPSGTFSDVSERLDDLDVGLVNFGDHANLVNVIWAAGGHTGTPNFLAGFDGVGNPTNIDPTTIGTLDHTDLANKVWASSQHTGTASYLAGFDGLGNPTNVDPGTVGGASDLVSVLTAGNITSGRNIIISSGDEISGVDAATGTDLILRPGDGSAGNDGAIHSGTAYGVSYSGNARGENAVDFQRFRAADTQVASGKASFIAGGYNCTASGGYTTASGYNSIASAWSSHVEGVGAETRYDPFLGSSGCHAEGGYTIAAGRYAHAEGYKTYAYSRYSHTEGYYTSTKHPSYAATYHARGAHAEGSGSISVWIATHAEGKDTIAGFFAPGILAWNGEGTGAHAEGNGSIAYGAASHAEGSDTFASRNGDSSHAEGNATHTNGFAAHAEGVYSTAFGHSSHAGGKSSFADTASQWARSSGDQSGVASGKGGSQQSLFHLGARTTNGDSEVMSSNGDNLVLRDSMTWVFRIFICARQTAGTAGTVGDSRVWEAIGAIKRDASDNTALLGSVTLNSIANDAGAAAWTVTVTANDTNESLDVTVTGELDKTIVWSTTVLATEAGLGQDV